MLTGIHFLLTYTCNFECDHCFLFCSPKSQGTFTIDQVQEALKEAQNIGSIEWIFFEGGEPFLYFPLLNESIKYARRKGFSVGVVTNAYGCHSKKDAELWLKPLSNSGLSFLSISNDAFHYGKEKQNPAAYASRVAQQLGIDTNTICIESPKVSPPSSEDKGQPVVGGGAKFRGQAAEKLIQNLPQRPWEELCECPDEDLASPSRVHIDSYGNVMICQGISIGNMWQTPIYEIVAGYRSDHHPICGPLLRGGPAQLARALGTTPDAGYIDECHLCYLTRKAIIDKYPDYLTPRQVYGMA
jgi:hypothetical protein